MVTYAKDHHDLSVQRIMRFFVKDAARIPVSRRTATFTHIVNMIGDQSLGALLAVVIAEATTVRMSSFVNLEPCLMIPFNRRLKCLPKHQILTRSFCLAMLPKTQLAHNMSTSPRSFWNWQVKFAVAAPRKYVAFSCALYDLVD